MKNQIENLILYKFYLSGKSDEILLNFDQVNKFFQK
jgi:hypothetical protein